MKKMNKILLGGLLCATGFAFAGKVSAAAPIEYPVFKGRNVLYNKVQDKVCYSEGSENGNCKSYAVSVDAGASSNMITVTDGQDTFDLNKLLYAGSSYVVSASKKINPSDIEPSCDSNGDCGDVDIAQVDGVTKLKYFLYDDFKSIIENAQKYDNIYTKDVSLKNYKLNIPKDVVLNVTYLDTDSLCNNGTINTGYLIGKNITGDGTINFDHDIFVGTGFDDKSLDIANRLSASPISGVKLNFRDKYISDGAPFCLIGKATNITKEKAQEQIDMYNKVLGSSFDGYEVKLNTKMDGIGENAQEYYYGVLAKKEIKTEEQQEVKKEVKNPSTGDPTIMTLITLVVSGALLTITYKKVKQK